MACCKRSRPAADHVSCATPFTRLSADCGWPRHCDGKPQVGSRLPGDHAWHLCPPSTRRTSRQLKRSKLRWGRVPSRAHKGLGCQMGASFCLCSLDAPSKAVLSHWRRVLGEVPERSNGAVSKTVVPLTGDRGFESLPLRDQKVTKTLNPSNSATCTTQTESKIGVQIEGREDGLFAAGPGSPIAS